MGLDNQTFLGFYCNLFCHCPQCGKNLMGTYPTQPRGINFISQSCSVQNQVAPDQWLWGKKKKVNKIKRHFLLIFMAKEAEKCPIPCICVWPHQPMQGASVSKFKQILSSFSSPTHRCLPKDRFTAPITHAFTSLLCLRCSSLAWSSCERINWLQSCVPKEKSCLWAGGTFQFPCINLCSKPSQKWPSLTSHMGPDSRALLANSGPSSKQQTGCWRHSKPRSCLLTCIQK